MAHCYSIKIEINGEEKEICTTHAEGNEELRKDIEKGNVRSPTEEEVHNAIAHYKKYGDERSKRPAIEGYDDKDLSPAFEIHIGIGGGGKKE